MTSVPTDKQEQGPWNPGIKSTLPAKYQRLSTMFRTENVFTSIETATELSDFTGLPIQQLVCFRPERLVVHELLIRVSADILVSDGSRYEDLGVNFRKVVSTILEKYVKPHMADIVEIFGDFEQRLRVMVDDELASSLFVQAETGAQPEPGFRFANLFKSNPKKTKPQAQESIEIRDQRLLREWRQKTSTETDPLKRAMFQSLGRVASAISIKHGRLIGDKSLLTSLVTGLVCNDYGSEKIGETIAAYLVEAAGREGYTLLPARAQPIVINVKGASASGKSTMRPLQKKHAEKLGIDWNDFALISPDIWRKYLLDYDSLGEAYKYAGMLAGDELPIIDQKLDQYIGKKASLEKLSHLLIDRFRFDSFASGADASEGSNLLTRFGHTIYLNFIVTPPEATVERAWIRGLQVGRYKAVDDLLDHNIEAFKGMPVLFFTWALRKDKRVHFEFLDNSGPIAKRPKTIAFGFNGEMYILDIKCMLDIERYTKININATAPDQVYPSASAMEARANTDFMVNCARKIPKIYFVDRSSGQVYACMENAQMSWIDPQIVQQKLEQEDSRAGLLAVAPNLIVNMQAIPCQQANPIPSQATRHTMGDLG